LHSTLTTIWAAAAAAAAAAGAAVVLAADVEVDRQKMSKQLSVMQAHICLREQNKLKTNRGIDQQQNRQHYQQKPYQHEQQQGQLTCLFMLIPNSNAAHFQNCATVSGCMWVQN
jgi:hypothetical protein